MKHTRSLIAALLLAPLSALQAAEGTAVQITVDPYCQRSIGGISELKRETYFGLCDAGNEFERRCRSKERYDFLVKENGITFGRSLGVVNGLERRDKALKEEAAQAGFADMAELKSKLTLRLQEPSAEFKQDMGGRLEVVSHEKPNGFPTFMGDYLSKAAAREKEPCHLPANLAAAAQLTAATLRWGFTDFNRPAFYELINEPHWSYWKDAQLAQWHLKTLEAVHREAPGVLVGGPCLPVAYFYKKQYAAFDGLKTFIENTRCGLDFYSFHVYDFLREKNGAFGGRITSGLPLESVLDLVQNHTMNTYGKEIGLVVSEHGGYGANEFVEKLARARIPGSGFEWEMKKRSIDDFNMVSSVIANTLVFMDHPQTIRKAVPFILLDAMGWNPQYYAVLFVPRDYKDKRDWVPTQKIMFYRLFRDLKGHRVAASCSDPDLQARAFVDGQALFVVFNNLSNHPKDVKLAMPRAAKAIIRRFGRNDDFTPYLTEESVELRGPLAVRGRESIVIKAELPQPLTPLRAINEVPCYGDRTAAAVTDGAMFTIKVPRARELRYATLRVGISRPPETGREVNVSLNGRTLVVPLEQCAERLVEDEYATCKIIDLPLDALQDLNTIRVSFPDGQKGAVGAVVIRAGFPATVPAKNKQP
jgi:hypothetical protein